MILWKNLDQIFPQTRDLSDIHSVDDFDLNTYPYDDYELNQIVGKLLLEDHIWSIAKL